MFLVSRSDQGLSSAPSRSAAAVVGGACWILSLAFMVGQVVAQLAWNTPYSLLDNRISDLGSTSCGVWITGQYICSPLHGVMDACIVATGACFALGAVLTWRAWPRRRLSTWGLALIAVAGAGLVLVGLFPENVNVGLHLLGALNIPMGNVALLLLGFATWKWRRWVGVTSIVMALIGFSGVAVGPALLALTGGHGDGLAERVSAYPIIAWMVVVGTSIALDRFRSARS